MTRLEKIYFAHPSIDEDTITWLLAVFENWWKFEYSETVKKEKFLDDATRFLCTEPLWKLEEMVIHLGGDK